MVEFILTFGISLANQWPAVALFPMIVTTHVCALRSIRSNCHRAMARSSKSRRIPFNLAQDLCFELIYWKCIRIDNRTFEQCCIWMCVEPSPSFATQLLWMENNDRIGNNKSAVRSVKNRIGDRNCKARSLREKTMGLAVTNDPKTAAYSKFKYAYNIHVINKLK